MHQLVEVKPKYEVVRPDMASVGEDSIKVDTERLGNKRIVSFKLMVNGRCAGTLSRYGDGQWRAGLKEGYLRGYDECHGYGSTPDEAIQDALTGGFNELLELVESVKRIKRELRSKKAVVEMVEGK